MGHPALHTHVNYDHAPFLVIWEITRACPLACAHCRASAQATPLPGELSTEEGYALIRQVVEMGCKVLILSGGDPLSRADLFDLIAYAKGLGLRVATIPAASEKLTRDVVHRLKESGIVQVAYSLDFPRPELHDGFRGTPWAFERTLKAIEWAHEVNLPVQINTVITAQTLPYLREMVALLTHLNIVFWEVFFLVPVGRGKNLSHLSPQACEEAFHILYETQKDAPYVLKVTEAPHYRRFVAHQEAIGATLSPMLRRSEGPGSTMGHAPRAVNSGKGFMFVAYNGDVSPSGFLPKASGNVRTSTLSQIYRDTALFQDLRNVTKLRGKCGRCEFSNICGGSRSRAFVMTGDPLASDPWCAYVPHSMRKEAHHELPLG